MRDQQLTAQGFFQKHHKDVRSSMDDVDLKNFTNLDDDDQRIGFLRNTPQIKSFNPALSVRQTVVISTEKNPEKSRELKASGNNAVKVGDWKTALDLYTQSYLYMPTGYDDEISVIMANRSAALYHLKHYELALIDIETSLTLGYPKDLKYKILDRKARCYLALKWNDDAIEAFKLTVSALDDSKLPKDRCQKMQTDAQVMIEILIKSNALLNEKNRKAIAALDKSLGKKEIPLPAVFGKNNDVFKNATDALDIQSNESDGRYAVAKTDINVGECVVAEKPHCSVLLAEFSRTHCQNCFVKCISPQVCPDCTNVIFCSPQCKKIALDSYHKFECPILQMIWESGCSITCHMALRIITQRDLTYFTNLKPKLNTKTNKYQSTDYKCVYDLVRHETIRSKADFFQRTHMAVFLMNLLRTTKYFDSLVSQDTLYDTETYIGGLIMRNLQVLQFNAHEIFELQCERPKVNDKAFRKDLGKSVFLGGGLYPTLALFNHSCDPGVTRYFQGTSVIVRTVKNIKQNEQISENYGPIFTRKPLTERRTELKDQYWFDCHCTSCEQNWPRYEEMDEGIIRFKCDAGSSCTNVIPVPIDCDEFMIKCGLCDQMTNILKGLKSLQDTETAQKIGKDHMEKGEYSKALSKFIEELKLYDETLAPPFKDYHMCQQNIRRCLLTYGNFSIN